MAANRPDGLADLEVLTTLMDERKFFTESNTTKPITLQCPYCRSTEPHELRWLVRTKKNSIPPGADERDRLLFRKAQSYMVLLDDKAVCRNLRCRKRFDITGIKTTAFLVADQGGGR